MKMIALDLSLTATGYAEYNGSVHYGVLHPGKGVNGLARLKWIRESVLKMCEGADLVVFEGLSYGSNDPSAQERAGLAFLIRMALWERGTAFVLCAPTTLKKWITGKGNAQKSQVIKEVFKRFQIDAEDDNAADAVALLFLGMALCDLWQVQTQDQAAIVSKIRSNNQNIFAAARNNEPALHRHGADRRVHARDRAAALGAGNRAEGESLAD